MPPTGCVPYRSGFRLAPTCPTLCAMQTFGKRSRDSDGHIDANVRMTVQEAADSLGVTVEAIRGRMHRGKYLKEKDDEGRVWVLLPPDQLPNGRGEVYERSSERSGTGSGERSDDRSRADGPNVYRRVEVAPDPELVEELRGEVAYLKEIVATRDEEIRRRDHIIMALTERVPELVEAPQNDQEDAQRPTGGSAGVESQEEPERRSWWRRVFGG